MSGGGGGGGVNTFAIPAGERMGGMRDCLKTSIVDLDRSAVGNIGVCVCVRGYWWGVSGMSEALRGGGLPV